jgi:hypothetical protein
MKENKEIAAMIASHEAIMVKKKLGSKTTPCCGAIKPLRIRCETPSQPYSRHERSVNLILDCLNATLSG